MKLKLVGGSLSALLLAAALAGCTGGNGGATSGTGTAANFSGSDAIAKVGDSSVTRADLAQTLEGIYGERVLPTLIDTQLLEEDAKKKNITISDDELNAELTRFETQDPTIKTAIDAGGPRADFYKNQVRRTLLMQKLLTADFKDDEAGEKKFFDTYASYYGTPAQNKLGILAAQTKTRADQLTRALKANPNSFDSLVAEQKAKGASDQLASLSSTGTGTDAVFESPEDFGSKRFPAQLAPQLTPILAPLIKNLTTAKKGQILPTFSFSASGPFFIVKVVDRKEATKPTYDQVKTQVATDYKLAQAATAEIKKNPGNPTKLEDNVKSVVAYLAQSNPQTGAPGIKASLRDALNFILSPASQTLLQGLRTNGTVTISDQSYKDLAKEYQAAPAAGAGNVAVGNAAGNGAAENTTTNTAVENTATNTATTNTATTNGAAPSTP